MLASYHLLASTFIKCHNTSYPRQEPLGQLDTDVSDKDNTITQSPLRKSNKFRKFVGIPKSLDKVKPNLRGSHRNLGLFLSSRLRPLVPLSLRCQVSGGNSTGSIPKSVDRVDLIDLLLEIVTPLGKGDALEKRKVCETETIEALK
ncbi:MAG: hypothetical protein JOS17DRAFT_797947 [Linnemannia elongata]|nr:MAG: hypothetical protein JOS17DRAFT_797947 [Linnemannia elongata]